MMPVPFSCRRSIVGHASSSLKEQVRISAPFSGQYPLKQIQRFSSPASRASPCDRYVTGPAWVGSVPSTGSQSA